MSAEYLVWVRIAKYIGYVGFVGVVVFGFLLIFLNLFCVKKIFGTYKYLMIIFTLVGMTFSISEILIQPLVHNFNDGYIYMSMAEPFQNSQQILKVLLGIFPGLYAVTVCLLAIQFIYRYWAVFNATKLRFFRGWRILIWLFYCSYFFLQWFLSCHFFIEPDKVSSDYFRDELYAMYNLVLNEAPVKIMLAYDPIDESIRWNNFLYTANQTIVISTQYCIMAHCGYKMYSKMGERIQNLSKKHREHHTQLFRTLVVQITAPSVLLFCPLAFIIYLPYFNFNIRLPTGIVLEFFTLYPAMDSIVVICLVTEFRRALKRSLIATLNRFISKRDKNESTKRDSTGRVHMTKCSNVIPLSTVPPN